MLRSYPGDPTTADEVHDPVTGQPSAPAAVGAAPTGSGAGRMTASAHPPRTGRYIASGTCPDAAPTPDAPPHIDRVQSTCRALRDRIEQPGDSARAVARRAGVAHTTVTRVLRGETWCDVATLAALEDALEHDVWVARDSRGRRDEGRRELTLARPREVP